MNIKPIVPPIMTPAPPITIYPSIATTNNATKGLHSTRPINEYLLIIEVAEAVGLEPTKVFRPVTS